MPPVAPILLVAQKLEPSALAQFRGRPFADMIKFVVDVEQGVVALGGELHVDAEAVLLDRGCEQEALWGGNYYPGRGPEKCVEYSSMLNIRPAQENASMTVLDAGIRERMRDIVQRLIGRGEPWP